MRFFNKKTMATIMFIIFITLINVSTLFAYVGVKRVESNGKYSMINLNFETGVIDCKMVLMEHFNVKSDRTITWNDRTSYYQLSKTGVHKMPRIIYVQTKHYDVANNRVFKFNWTEVPSLHKDGIDFENYSSVTYPSKNNNYAEMGIVFLNTEAYMPLVSEYLKMGLYK